MAGGRHTRRRCCDSIRCSFTSLALEEASMAFVCESKSNGIGVIPIRVLGKGKADHGGLEQDFAAICTLCRGVRFRVMVMVRIRVRSSCRERYRQIPMLKCRSCMHSPCTIFIMHWFGGDLPAWVSCFAAFVFNVKNVEDAEVPTVVKDFPDVFGVQFG